MSFEPRGLTSQKHPLHHKFSYAFQLSGKQSDENSAWAMLCRNTKSCVTPTAVLVNPKHASMDEDTGTACYPMSILTNMRISVKLWKSTVNNTTDEMYVDMIPFFASFLNKYDAADTGGATVKSMMQLTTDDTNEDVVPLTANKLLLDGPSELSHPVTTVGFTEAFGDLNMTTDVTMEATAFDTTAFYDMLKLGTNKGALKACLGRTRHFNLTNIGGGGRNSRYASFYSQKFLPRPVRRMVPFSFFGLLFHLKMPEDIDGPFNDATLTADKPHVGIRVNVRYNEWNEDFSNAMT